MRARGFLPSDPADFLRSIVPLALLVAAAILPAVRLGVVVALIAGTGIAIGRAAPVRWAWAAAVPVGVGLAWEALRSSTFTPGNLDCTSPTSAVAIDRLIAAFIVVGAVAVLAMLLNASRASLGLALPPRRYAPWALLGFLVAGPGALILGPILSRPFFGDVGYDISQPAAIVPALIFAVSNGILEELAYRGALLTWSARVIGTGPALLGQALIFGLAHSGTDVLAGQAILMIGMTLAGLLAGSIALRTRSLLVPIAIHIGLDIPLYYAWACSTLP